VDNGVIDVYSLNMYQTTGHHGEFCLRGNATLETCNMPPITPGLSSAKPDDADNFSFKNHSRTVLGRPRFKFIAYGITDGNRYEMDLKRWAVDDWKGWDHVETAWQCLRPTYQQGFSDENRTAARYQGPLHTTASHHFEKAGCHCTPRLPSPFQLEMATPPEATPSTKLSSLEDSEWNCDFVNFDHNNGR
jgi:hypothetical protein